MEATTILHLQILDAEERSVKDPRIRIFSRGQKGQEIKVSFSQNEENHLWASTPLDHGKYIVEVAAKGLGSEKIKVNLKGPQQFLKIELGEEGASYIKQGGRRVRFQREPGKLGLILRKGLSEEIEKEEKPTRRITRNQKSLRVSPSMDRIRKQRLQLAHSDPLRVLS